MADKIEDQNGQGAAAASQAPGATMSGEGSAASLDDSGGGLTQALRDEIDASVDLAMKDLKSKGESDEGDKAKAKSEGDAKEDLNADDDPPVEGEGDKGGKSPEGDNAGDKEEGEKKDEKQAGEAPAITDENLTRAVKAGLSLTEARTFKDAKALDRVCELLEKKAEKESAADVAAGKKDGESKEEDPLAGILDLDPEEYDEKLVSGFKAMKDIIRKQHDTIGKLVASGSKPDQTWMDDRIATLGDVYSEVLGKGPTSKLDPNGPQAKKRAELNEKMNILLSGYKAAGKDSDRGSVFAEAVNVVLHDVVQKVAQDVKTSKLVERSKQHTARPGGNKSAPAGDVIAEVSDELDRKYFGKK